MTTCPPHSTTRAEQLWQLTLSDPLRVELGELREILETPSAPPLTHSAALIALYNVVRAREDVDAHFVDLVGQFFNHHVLLIPIFSAVSANSPQMIPLRSSISETKSRLALSLSRRTQAATGCCVELVQIDPAAFADLTPALSALLDAENETVRSNALYRSMA